MKIKLDRTLCAGFGSCADHAPTVFDLDDWGYASLATELAKDPEVPDALERPVRRALLDCPVHAIIERRSSQ
jgi:ferredoxin